MFRQPSPAPSPPPLSPVASLSSPLSSRHSPFSDEIEAHYNTAFISQESISGEIGEPEKDKYSITFPQVLRAVYNTGARLFIYPLVRLKYVQQVYGRDVGIKSLIFTGGVINLYHGALWEACGFVRSGIALFANSISFILEDVPKIPPTIKENIGPVLFTVLLSPLRTIQSIYASDAEHIFSSYEEVINAFMEARGPLGFVESSILSLLELYVYKKVSQATEKMSKAYVRTVNGDGLLDRLSVMMCNGLLLLLTRAVCYPLHLISTDMMASYVNHHYGDHTGLKLVYHIIRERGLGLWDGIHFHILHNLLFSFRVYLPSD